MAQRLGELATTEKRPADSELSSPLEPLRPQSRRPRGHRAKGSDRLRKPRSVALDACQPVESPDLNGTTGGCHRSPRRFEPRRSLFDLLLAKKSDTVSIRLKPPSQVRQGFIRPRSGRRAVDRLHRFGNGGIANDREKRVTHHPGSVQGLLSRLLLTCNDGVSPAPEELLDSMLAGFLRSECYDLAYCLSIARLSQRLQRIDALFPPFYRRRRSQAGQTLPGFTGPGGITVELEVVVPGCLRLVPKVKAVEDQGSVETELGEN